MSEARDVAELGQSLAAELVATGTPERAEGEKRYLKSPLEHYGVPVPAIRKLAKATVKRTTDRSRDDVLALGRWLWSQGVHELRTLAALLLEGHAGKLQAKDLSLVDAWIREAAGWAHVDLLSIRVAGPLVQRFSSCRQRLDRWARDDDLWIRRSAMTALILELRDGAPLDQFERYAVPMMEERDFFIRKAIGWVAREASKASPEDVAAFCERHAGVMSGLSFREATKNLEPTVRDRLLASRRRNAR